MCNCQYDKPFCEAVRFVLYVKHTRHTQTDPQKGLELCTLTVQVPSLLIVFYMASG